MGIREKIRKWCPQPEHPALTNLRHYYKPITAALAAAILTISAFVAVSLVMTQPTVPPIPLVTPKPTPTPTLPPSPTPTETIPLISSPTASPSPSIGPQPSPTNSPSPSASIVTIANPDSWAARTPMPTIRSGVALATVNAKIYAIGGYVLNGANATTLGSNEVYDPKTDTWTERAPTPTLRNGFGVAVWQNKIYTIGGGQENAVNGSNGMITYEYSYLSTNEAYDPATDTWASRAPMPVAQPVEVAGAFNAKIYAAFLNFTNKPANSPSSPSPVLVCIEVYDPAQDNWTLMPQSTVPTGFVSIEFCSMSFLDGKLYIMAHGWDSTTYPTQIFDVETGTWSIGKPIPSFTYAAPAASTGGDSFPKLIYVIGGANPNPFGLPYFDTVQIYDVQSDTWSSTSVNLGGNQGILPGVVVENLLFVIGNAINEQYTPVGYK